MGTKIAGTKPIRVDGAFITAAIRADAKPFELCAKCCPTLTAEQIAKIIDGRAEIIGDSIDGFEYAEH